MERYEDISVLKRKNSEFYLLEPLKSPGLIRSFFGFVRRNFEQVEVPPPKNTQLRRIRQNATALFGRFEARARPNSTARAAEVAVARQADSASREVVFRFLKFRISRLTK